MRPTAACASTTASTAACTSRPVQLVNTLMLADDILLVAESHPQLQTKHLVPLAIKRMIFWYVGSALLYGSPAWAPSQPGA